ncbi:MULTISPECIES: NTP/NDP exchange transporter [Pseudomonas]|jgi:AAA family ATP:ADP antiporter|uniref:AAA family ATP:ADP antiporter n=2 Tax=Pseudomonas TaxID=286 RepID=A0A9X8EJV8_PSEPU|nr:MULTISPECIES: MFS transporter [Pseudomonas]KTC24971.1 ADP/ATP translocating protein [Pseudomonas putida]MCO7504322.1 MFS transporter [Pseudomonas sp. VE 267-6A]MCO7529532.1 MFS transporter [Pseudomonas sp. 2]MCP8347686.1 MFS transporter [Pseudomonas sp. FBF18]MCQ0167375.1 MFS transporter [Pseudomonas sp. S12(2018)]
MRLLGRLFTFHDDETPAVVGGLALFFLLFAGYFMLRPVRETMGVAGGVDNLQWLFTGTFIVTLLALPLFGWVVARARRRRILPWTYGFLASNLLAFALVFAVQPDNLWVARAFYIWLSVFNLLSISLAWSVLADLFSNEQAKRLFGLLAAGASLGGLVGPILGTLLVGVVGHAGLVLLATLFLLGSIGAATYLQRWRDRAPLPAEAEHPRSRPLGGNPFAGAGEVLRSPYLLMLALFVVLLASISTFLYFEQARLVAQTFTDRTRQTQVFGLIDTVVQALAILTQLFFTGRIARRMGVGVLLVAVPLVMVAGFLWLALAPVFAVFVVVMVVRRAGEYALVRPGREMLYTVLPAEQKYRAKNFIDTVVYRGGDALSGWVKRGLDVLGEHPQLAMLIGAGIALGWAATGGWLGRRQRRLEQRN